MTKKAGWNAKKKDLDRPTPPVDARTTVAFAPWSIGQFDRRYFKVHYSEDGTTLLNQTPDTTVRLEIDFAAEAKVSGKIAYELSGDALAGENFTLLSPQPLPFEKGDVSARIEVELLDAGRWFREREIRVVLTGGQNVVVDDDSEFRLYVRPTDDPPVVEWSAAASSGGPGVYDIEARLDAPSAEPTTLHYLVRGSAERGADGDFDVDSPGTVTIPAGATSATVELTIHPGATAGAVVLLALHHERDDGSNQNHWTFSHDWSLEVDELPFPGEPSTHISDGGQFVVGTPQKVVAENRGVIIVPQASATPKPAWDGHVLQGIVQSPWIQSNFYIRESFECSFHAAGPPRLMTLDPYTRVSVYVDTFGPPEEDKNSRFVRLTLRNRVLDLNHAVMFDRESDGTDWQGNPVPTVATDSGTWGLWRTVALHPDDELGVVEETIDGRNYTRLYLMHHADDVTTYVNAKGKMVVETVGVDRMNAILRFTYFSSTDGSLQATGGAMGNRGKGLLGFFPYCERSAAVLSGPPPEFWERRRNWWEPRGNATMAATGGNDVYAFTIS